MIHVSGKKHTVALQLSFLFPNDFQTIADNVESFKQYVPAWIDPAQSQ